jgi:uncharacterized BrkB/YihY/UPF0761 family membrane protein
MKKLRTAIFTLFVSVSIPILVTAHPEHGGDEGDHGFTIIHYFTQPVHLIITIPVVIFLAWYGIKSYRRKTGNR